MKEISKYFQFLIFVNLPVDGCLLTDGKDLICLELPVVVEIASSIRIDLVLLYRECYLDLSKFLPFDIQFIPVIIRLSLYLTFRLLILPSLPFHLSLLFKRHQFLHKEVFEKTELESCFFKLVFVAFRTSRVLIHFIGNRRNLKSEKFIKIKKHLIQSVVLTFIVFRTTILKRLDSDQSNTD
jgi:hypothetical protein